MVSRIDRYEIKSLIGTGGMGSLYLARDTNPNTNRLVALKVLNAHLDSSDLRERFARESRALAALHHPNIVNIFDSGEFQGSPYIVMEYISGETLAEKIRRRAPLTVAEKLKMMAELCAGLAHAHEAGIIHRDIKPANLIIDQYGRLRILDFGIARAADANMTRFGAQMTQFNMRIGTPGYMSPEQIEGGEIDGRSDVFAAGTVFYELLSYREAFTGGSTRQIEDKVLQAQPTPLLSLLPGLDPEIAAIATRALEKSPAGRFQDATAFEQALEQQRWRLGPSHTPPPVRSTPLPTPASGRGSHESRAQAAYQRASAANAEGAPDAARRFLLEALAEDPHHAASLNLLRQLDPNPWPSASPLSEPTPLPGTWVESGTVVDPTVVAVGGLDPTVVRPQSQRRGSTPRPPTVPRWKKYRWPAAVAGFLMVASAAVFFVVRGGWSSGYTLTISRPTGGTLVTKGIACGVLGSNCDATFDRGQIVELQRQPDSGYVFAGYTGDCAPSGRVMMTAARTCGATFDKIPDAPKLTTFPLTITRPSGGTIVALGGISCGPRDALCSIQQEQGAKVKLDAIPEPGFKFARFTGECYPDGVATMTQGRSCGADFALAPPGGPVAKNQTTIPGPVPALPPTRPTNPGPSSPLTPQTPASSVATATAPSLEAPTEKGPAAPPGTTPLPPVGSVGTSVTLEAPPPPPPDVVAKRFIEQVLKDWCAANEKLDPLAMKAIYPSVNTTTLRDTFRQYKSLDCKVTLPPTYVSLEPVRGKAVVEVEVKQVADKKVGGSQTQEMTSTVTLSRAEERGRWNIDNLNSKAKRK